MRLTCIKPQSQDAFSRLFENDVFSWYPAVDVIEEKDHFILKADLPGLKKEDIKITVEAGVLTIEGERKADIETQDKQYHRLERAYGRFVRALDLGRQAEYNNIQANYKDGVLEVVVPRSEAAKPKHIDINVQ